MRLVAFFALGLVFGPLAVAQGYRLRRALAARAARREFARWLARSQALELHRFRTGGRS